MEFFQKIKVRVRLLNASLLFKIKQVSHVEGKFRRESGNYGNERVDFHPRLNIALKYFDFYHRESTSDKIDDKYIQRPKFEEKLKNWLTEDSGHGVYLVTGHRGTGKSSLVGAVIKDLKDESNSKMHLKNKLKFVFNLKQLFVKVRVESIEKARGKQYIDVCVNIGQENIDELNFLRVLAKTLRDKMSKAVRFSRFQGNVLGQASWYVIYSEIKRFKFPLLALWSACIYFLVEFGKADAPKYGRVDNSLILTAICIVCAVVSAVLFLCYRYQILGRDRAIMHLDRLCENLYAVTRQKNGFAFVDAFKSVIGKEREIPPLTVQEIEYELISILDLVKDRFSIVIVLDELDKVDKVEKEGLSEHGGGAGEDVFRQFGQYAASQIRRQRVLAMIANMKYFLSTASAYFIFIAGRELHEAAMADISDREFAIGNLFNGILQIDSFYTKNGLSDAITLTEEFVCGQIAGVENIEKLYETCMDKGLITFLYHFICYLAFISHGSPKKIAVFFEKYVRSYQFLKEHNQDFGIDEYSDVTKWYLTFSDHQQMKINFVHHLTFPILQNIMNRSAIFGDKLRVAESFIFAHIVKLHNSGFSWRNIEQIPEIMAINREPEVREYIQAILMNMQQQGRIKQIVCGLYTYKFPLQLAEEISYFSKLSDELSALLNFSIGELQPVKEYYCALLDKLPADVRGKKHVYAEASVRHALGDIYMQEENFSAAIRQFERCVELVTPLLIKPGVDKHLQLHNYVLFYYRTMLKLGLAHEKRHTENSTYAIYTDLLDTLFEVKRKVPKAVASLLRDNRGLHLGILARLYVLERMGTTGITCWHVNEAIAIFKKLYTFNFGNGDDNLCNRIVQADFYRKLGDALFYKNFECTGQGYSAIWSYTEGIRALLKGCGLNGVDLWGKTYNYIFIQGNNTIRNSCHGDKTWVYSLAILFESLGHAYLGNWDVSQGIIDSNNLMNFARAVLGHINRVTKLRKLCPKVRCHLLNIVNQVAFLKGLYCYWFAAKLYDIATENQAMARNYRHLLFALELYVKQYYGNKKITVFEKTMLHRLLEMADCMTRRMIMGTYRSYEYVNMLEWNWSITNSENQEPDKNNGKKAGGKKRRFLYADMEDSAYAYFRLLIAYCDIDAGAEFIKVHDELCRVLLQVRRIDAVANSTLTTLINRHRLILCIYKYYLFSLLRQEEKPWHVSADIPCMAVQDFMAGGIKKMFDFVLKLGPIGNLEKILELPVGGNIPRVTSLRKYNRKKRQPKFLVFKRYRWKLLNKILADAVRRSDEILKWMVGPLQVTTLFNHTFQGNVYNDYAIFLKLYKQLAKYAKEKGISDFDNVFEGQKKSPRYANEDYLVERALQSYGSVLDCHGMGTAYQDLIQQLYFLEDDFNNDTIQFYFATERIGLQRVKEKEKKLRKDSENHADYYRLESYESIESCRSVSVR